MNRQITAAIDPKSSNREASIASRALLAADALNAADEQKQREDQLERLLAKLEEIYGLSSVVDTVNGMAASRNGHSTAKNGARP
jgi:hypothetical protein